MPCGCEKPLHEADHSQTEFLCSLCSVLGELDEARSQTMNAVGSAACSVGAYTYICLYMLPYSIIHILCAYVVCA
jgi:hypothetical protein